MLLTYGSDIHTKDINGDSCLDIVNRGDDYQMM